MAPYECVTRIYGPVIRSVSRSVQSSSAAMIAAPLVFTLLSFVRLSLFPRPVRSYTKIRAKRTTRSWTLGQEEDDSPAPGMMITIGSLVHVVTYPATGSLSEALYWGRAWRGGPLTEMNRRWVPIDTSDEREVEVSQVESRPVISFWFDR